MNKAQWMTLAYWIMIAVVIVTCIFILKYLSGNAHQCLADPMAFYQNKTGLYCYCIEKFIQ
jgi:hypothetical protein